MPTALIVLAEGFEELEAVTVMDLFVRAGIEVTRAGLRGDGVVKASRHTRIVPDCAFADCLNHSYDVVVLPGGLPGADHLAASPELRALLRRQLGEGRIIGAICAAPRALLAAEVTAGRRITAFPGALATFSLGDTELCDEAVCVDGTLITSRGPGTAMDFALTLIEQLCGRTTRDKVEHALVR